MGSIKEIISEREGYNSDPNSIASLSIIFYCIALGVYISLAVYINDWVMTYADENLIMPTRYLLGIIFVAATIWYITYEVKKYTNLPLVKVLIENNSYITIYKTIGKHILDRQSYPFNQIKCFTYKSVKNQNYYSTYNNPHYQLGSIGCTLFSGEHYDLCNINAAKYSKIKLNLQRCDIEFIDIDLLMKQVNQRQYSDMTDYQLTKKLNQYNKILEYSPNEAEAYYERADVYYELEKYDLALEDLNKALQYNYEDKEFVYMQIGNIKEELKDYQGAITQYRNAAKAAENDMKGFFLFGTFNVYKKMKDYNSALEVCNEVIRIDKEDFIYYLSRSECEYKLNDYDSALKDYLIANELLEKDMLEREGSKTEDDIKADANRYYFGYLLYTALNKEEEANRCLRRTYSTNKDFKVNEFYKEIFAEDENN